MQGLPPQVDLANEAKLADFFVGNTSVAASHDLSEGGLAIAAFEMAQKNNVGVDLDLSVVHEDALTALFSESASRVLISTASDHLDGVLERASELGIPAVVVGTTNDSGNITFAGEEVATAELREVWSSTLPNLFGHAVGANSVVE